MGNHSQEHHVFDGDLNDALGVGGGCLPRGVRKSLRPHLDFPCCLKLSRDVSCGASRASKEQMNPAFAPGSTEGPWAHKVEGKRDLNLGQSLKADGRAAQ